MADFVQGLDPGKLVLSGAVRLPIPFSRLSSPHHAPFRRLCPLSSAHSPRRRTTSPSSSLERSRTRTATPSSRSSWYAPTSSDNFPAHPTQPCPRARVHSFPPSCPPRSSQISSGCSTTIKVALPNFSSSSCGCSRRVVAHLATTMYADMTLVPHCGGVLGYASPERLPIHGSRCRRWWSHGRVPPLLLPLSPVLTPQQSGPCRAASRRAVVKATKSSTTNRARAFPVVRLHPQRRPSSRQCRNPRLGSNQGTTRAHNDRCTLRVLYARL